MQKLGVNPEMYSWSEPQNQRLNRIDANKMTEKGDYGREVVRSEIIKGMEVRSEELSPRIKDLLAHLMTKK